MEKEKQNNSKKVVLELPKKYESPRIIPLSKSANLKDLECLAGRGKSCTWK